VGKAQLVARFDGITLRIDSEIYFALKLRFNVDSTFFSLSVFIFNNISLLSHQRERERDCWQRQSGIVEQQRVKLDDKRRGAMTMKDRGNAKKIRRFVIAEEKKDSIKRDIFAKIYARRNLRGLRGF